MKFALPSVSIENVLPEIKILQFIEKIGRTCYKSEDKITDISAINFVRNIISRKHGSVIEHYHISVRFILDRGVSHELVRHRLCSISQESTRYVNYDKKGLVFIIPSWIKYANVGGNLHIDTRDKDAEVWLKQLESAEDAYKHLIFVGWTPEKARGVLPHCLKTEMVVTANLREWRHILELRTGRGSHPQMIEIMKMLLDMFQKEMPTIFGDIGG